MIIAVVSDSHDHRKALKGAIEKSMAAGAQVLFHLGDLISPFMLSVLKDFPGRIYLAIGNNDGDLLTISRMIPQECPQVREFAHLVSVELDGVRVAAVHDPVYARALAATMDYDIVLCGHTHEFSQRMVGEALLLNPGDLMGLTGERSFCLVETGTKEVRKLAL